MPAQRLVAAIVAAAAAAVASSLSSPELDALSPLPIYADVAARLPAHPPCTPPMPGGDGHWLPISVIALDAATLLAAGWYNVSADALRGPLPSLYAADFSPIGVNPDPYVLAGAQVVDDVGVSRDGGVTWECAGRTPAAQRRGSAAFALRRVGRDGSTCVAACLAGGQYLQWAGPPFMYLQPVDTATCSTDGGRTWADAPGLLPAAVLGAVYVAINGTDAEWGAHVLVGGWRNDARESLFQALMPAPSGASGGLLPADCVPSTWAHLTFSGKMGARLEPLAAWMPVSQQLLVGGGHINLGGKDATLPQVDLFTVDAATILLRDYTPPMGPGVTPSATFRPTFGQVSVVQPVQLKVQLPTPPLSLLIRGASSLSALPARLNPLGAAADVLVLALNAAVYLWELAPRDRGTPFTPARPLLLHGGANGSEPVVTLAPPGVVLSALPQWDASPLPQLTMLLLGSLAHSGQSDVACVERLSLVSCTVPHEQCAAGERAAGCTTSPWAANCQPCTVCEVGEYEASPCRQPRSVADSVCAACTPCPAGFMVGVTCGQAGAPSASEHACFPIVRLVMTTQQAAVLPFVIVFLTGFAVVYCGATATLVRSSRVEATDAGDGLAGRSAGGGGEGREGAAGVSAASGESGGVAGQLAGSSAASAPAPAQRDARPPRAPAAAGGVLRALLWRSLQAYILVVNLFVTVIFIVGVLQVDASVPAVVREVWARREAHSRVLVSFAAAALSALTVINALVTRGITRPPAPRMPVARGCAGAWISRGMNALAEAADRLLWVFRPLLLLRGALPAVLAATNARPRRLSRRAALRCLLASSLAYDSVALALLLAQLQLGGGPRADAVSSMPSLVRDVTVLCWLTLAASLMWHLGDTVLSGVALQHTTLQSRMLTGVKHAHGGAVPGGASTFDGAVFVASALHRLLGGVAGPPAAPRGPDAALAERGAASLPTVAAATAAGGATEWGRRVAPAESAVYRPVTSQKAFCRPAAPAPAQPLPPVQLPTTDAAAHTGALSDAPVEVLLQALQSSARTPEGRWLALLLSCLRGTSHPLLRRLPDALAAVAAPEFPADWLPVLQKLDASVGQRFRAPEGEYGSSRSQSSSLGSESSLAHAGSRGAGIEDPL